MITLHSYLPQDRLRALAHNTPLPERCVGAALFADISGFTPLTEKLTHELGPRRGAEELSRQINAVYEALIAAIEHHGGSVISFAGDGMMCWFASEWPMADGEWQRGTTIGHPPSAIRCAFALQTAMQAFPHLGLKVAVTTGPARRLVVGDPAIQQLDILAGTTITRAATAEHLAQRGEVLTDEATARASAAPVATWRTDPESGERFAVVNQLNQLRVNSEELRVDSGNEPPQLFTLNSQLLTINSSLLTFLLPAVVARETSGQSLFLTEFRPCVALFVRFMGIEFEAEAAHAQLDALIRLVQTLAAQYAGTLLQVTIGDKGSYLYLSWGALSVHEDDARRAVKMGLALREQAASLSFLAPLHMGLTKGIMRVGAYGGPTRRTYDALGDAVNLAARLMQAAAPGEILISDQVQGLVAEQFVCAPRPALQLKGKGEKIPAFAVLGPAHHQRPRLQEPQYALPMVGRHIELQTALAKLDLVAAGHGQILGLIGEAGVGKSRLTAEIIRTARAKGFVVLGGACQSDGLHTPYLVWKAIWQAFFDLDPHAPHAQQINQLTARLQAQAPARLPALPLLQAVLDVPIPANAFTRHLDPKLRQSALHALLEDCLKAATQTVATQAVVAQAAPLLIVIEDLHWIDALSHELLEQLARALPEHPIGFVLVYRPSQAPRLAALPHFTRLALSELTEAEATQALRAKLAQLYPARSAQDLPPALEEKLLARAQGNPFYLEELLNYLRDRGIDPYAPTPSAQLELPDSLHTLILSRIDQLTEPEKTTLRVASIIGRLFRAEWLIGYYPALGELAQVKARLHTLARLDITPLDTPEPELTYLFKHIVTHEVTYESLPYATRAQLHEQLAQYLEATFTAAPPLEVLAYHYGQSPNTTKQRAYFRKAGEAAQATYANAAALAHYARLLPLLTEAAAQSEILLKRGAVLELIGQWAAAESAYRAALALVATDAAAQANAQFALGKLCRLRGDYAAALDWLAQAKAIHAALPNEGGLAQVLIETSNIFMLQGNYALAREGFTEGLRLARAVGHQANTATALNSLANLNAEQGDYATARALYAESLRLRRALGDKWGIAGSLHNLGLMAHSQGDYAAARALYAESLTLHREIGNKSGGLANTLNNLGCVVRDQGDTAHARTLIEESLTLYEALGNKSGLADALTSLALVALVAPRHPDEARQLLVRSLHLRQELGEQLPQTSNLIGVAGLALQQGAPRRAAQLLGAAVGVLSALKAVMDSDVQQTYARTLAATREQLAAVTFNAAWAAGEKMPLAAAVQFALQDVP